MAKDDQHRTRTVKADDDAAQTHRSGNPDGARTPPAGPHAKDALTDREKTPGTGALPERDQPEADVGPD